MNRDQTSSSPEGAAFYVPGQYANDDPAGIVRKYPFAQLISAGLHATATPLLFEDVGDCTTMIGHIARANPHAEKFGVEHDVLAIFTGPHAYISPRSYLERPSVPTWNYLIAHVRGRSQPVTEREDVLAILRRTIDHFEAANAPPWRIEDVAPDKVDELMERIVAFRIRVESIVGATKLSQLQPEGDRKRIIADLASRRETWELAEIMTAHYTRSPA